MIACDGDVMIIFDRHAGTLSVYSISRFGGMQRELRGVKDMASSSAAQAAGAEASQQDLQQLQVLLVACTKQCCRFTVTEVSFWVLLCT